MKLILFFTFFQNAGHVAVPKRSLRIEVLLKMAITRRGGTEMVITRRGDAENGHCESRWCLKWSLRVEVVLKMVITPRGDAEKL